MQQIFDIASIFKINVKVEHYGQNINITNKMVIKSREKVVFTGFTNTKQNIQWKKTLIKHQRNVSVSSIIAYMFDDTTRSIFLSLLFKLHMYILVNHR